MRKIEITARPDGTIQTETKGYVGEACQQADAFLHNAIGQTLADRPTAEAFATPTSEEIKLHGA